MNTWLNRLSAVLTSVFMVGLFMMSLVAFSSWMLNRSVQPENISIELHNVAMHRGIDGYYKKRTTDLAFFRFGLNADFTPLFRWNIKQVFVYLAVKYKNPEFVRNEVVLWDRIITQQDRPIIDDNNLSSEYTMADIKERLGSAEAYLELRWSVTPWAGPIMDYSYDATEIFTFPAAVEASKQRQ